MSQEGQHFSRIHVQVDGVQGYLVAVFNAEAPADDGRGCRRRRSSGGGAKEVASTGTATAAMVSAVLVKAALLRRSSRSTPRTVLRQPGSVGAELWVCGHESAGGGSVVHEGDLAALEVGRRVDVAVCPGETEAGRFLAGRFPAGPRSDVWVSTSFSGSVLPLGGVPALHWWGKAEGPEIANELIVPFGFERLVRPSVGGIVCPTQRCFILIECQGSSRKRGEALCAWGKLLLDGIDIAKRLVYCVGKPFQLLPQLLNGRLFEQFGVRAQN